MECLSVSALCREKFESIERRLHKGDAAMEEQDRAIRELSVLAARLGERITALSGSMRALTRALWGVTASAGAVLVGFLIWYIQTL